MRYFRDAGDGFYAASDWVSPSEGWQELTEAEWLLSNPQVVGNPSDAIRAQIDALERQQLMPRATREFMLMFMELNAPAEVLAVNPGYQAVKAFDEQIKALRAQL